MRSAITVGLFVWLAASPAAAQRLGTGTAHASPVTAPPTRNGASLEAGARPAPDLPLAPRHGMLGAPGAAQDALGPSRLGGHGERSARSSYGESAPGTGEAYSSWHSGDRVRSSSSTDVRGARQQQAPDLEWAK